ncbi:TRAP transporter substrate-binding protein [Methylocapsa sp. S129]|uniref:TRAP transporter substrate-binding protein n=1 Tax=Methylocapsa sp. S129 TaxID=1641869 RepID=UPI00131EAC74|nr:TRAP transporter substrate-binding protein [Methylocapsa sp. S129]
MSPSSVTRRQMLAASAAVLAGGGALSRPAAADQQVTLRVSSSDPIDENAAHYLWFAKFAANLKNAVGDRIKFDYFPNSQLGKEADVVEQVKIGSTDMMVTGSSIWATVAPELGMLDLGYMFDSYDHVAKAMDGEAGKALEKILADRTGVGVLGWGFHFGARSVYTKKPAARLADLKDVKLRVLPAPAFIETFKVMGAIPTPIPVNELYTALQTGVVDGFEHDPGTCLSLKLYEITKFCFLTEHLFSPMGAFIGKRALAKIPDDLKPAFAKAALAATAEERAVALEKTKSEIEQLKGFGVAFAAMPAEERRAMQDEMAKRLYADFAESHPATKPVFAAIAAARG